MTTLSAAPISIPKPPLVAIVQVLVDYTGNQSFFTVDFEVTTGHVLSDAVSLDGNYSLSPSINASLIPAAGALQRVYCAVKIYGLAPQVSTITATLSDSDGHTASTTFDVQVHGDTRIFQLPTHTAIVSSQAELDAAAQEGGRILLRGGQYKHTGAWVANGHAAIETHPEDWFNLGTPARLEGDGSPLGSGNNHRVWVTTRDGFNMRRIEISNTRYVAFLMQDVDSPLVDECILWNIQNQGTFKNTTNGIIRDSLVIGSWDSLTDGEHSNGLVISDNNAGSNNTIERSIVLGIGDDCIDFWQGHDTTLRNCFLGFVGKGGAGDGMGVKAGGGSSSGGSKVYLCSFFRARSFGINNNESTPDTPFSYHNNTSLECENGFMYADGSNNNNAHAQNNLDLDNISAGNYGSFNGTNNSWDLSLNSNASQILSSFHATWEGFDSSGFLKLPAADSAIDAGTSVGLLPGIPIIGPSPDIGAHEFGASLYKPPTIPVGIPSVSSAPSMQRYYPKRSSIPENAPVSHAEPAYLSYSDVPGTPNQFKRITDKTIAANAGADSGQQGLRHIYAQFQNILSDNQRFPSSSWYTNLWDLDGGFSRVIGNNAYFPRAIPGDANHVLGCDKQDPKRLIKVNVDDSAETLIKQFSSGDLSGSAISSGGTDVSIGRTQGLISRDGTRVVIQIKRLDGQWECFLLDLSNGNTLSQKVFSILDDYVTVHPDGQHILVSKNASYANGGGNALAGFRSYDIYDANFQYLKTIGISGHITLGFDLDDVTPLIFGECEWQLVKARLDTPVESPIRIGGGPNRFQNNPYSMSQHMSYCFDTPGHIVVSIDDPEGPRHIFSITAEPSDGNSENAMLWCYSNTSHGNYYAEGHANCTSFGDRIIFASDWGKNPSTDNVRTYLCQVKPASAPIFTTQSFDIGLNANIGTVVGQLVATDPQDGNSNITSMWRLQHLKNAGFAISDSGQITVAEATATQAEGAQTITAICEGVLAQTANTVTINVKPIVGAKGTISNPHVIYRDAGIQNISVLQAYTQNTTLVAIEDLPGEITTKTGGFGHFAQCTASFGLSSAQHILQSLAKLDAVIGNNNMLGAHFYIRWKDVENSKGVYNGWAIGLIQQILDKARPANTPCLFEVSDAVFGDSLTTLSQSICPTYVENEGRVVFSGNPTNKAITSNMATDNQTATYYINMVNAVFGPHNNDSALFAINTEESTRSESATPNGPYSGRDEEFINLMRDRFVPEIKATMTKTLFGLNINFGGSKAHIETLINVMEAVGGCYMTTPDTNVDRYSRYTPNGTIIEALDIMFERQNSLTVIPRFETRDLEDKMDDNFSMTIGTTVFDLVNRINPNALVHQGWHPTYGGSWDAMVTAKVDEYENAGKQTNQALPTMYNYQQGGTSIDGTDMLQSNPQQVNNTINVTPLLPIDVDSLDSMSIFVDEGAGVVESVRHFIYKDSPPQTSDGTLTSKYFEVLTIGNVPICCNRGANPGIGIC